MKVVTRKDIMELVKQKDILFSDIYSDNIADLHVASCFSEHDFVRTCLLSVVDNDKDSLTQENLDNKVPFELDLECGCRDGLYDEEAKYAIYERKDMDKLISKLKELNE